MHIETRSSGGDIAEDVAGLEGPFLGTLGTFELFQKTKLRGRKAFTDRKEYPCGSLPAYKLACGIKHTMYVLLAANWHGHFCSPPHLLTHRNFQYGSHSKPVEVNGSLSILTELWIR